MAELGAKASQSAAQAGLNAMSHWDGRAAPSSLAIPSLVVLVFLTLGLLWHVAVNGTVTMTSPAQNLQVRTAQPQLVSYD